MHRMIRGGRRGCLTVFTGPLNGNGGGQLQRGKMGLWSGRNCARFVLKTGLEIQLGIQLGVLWRGSLRPPTDKNDGKNGVF